MSISIVCWAIFSVAVNIPLLFLGVAEVRVDIETGAYIDVVIRRGYLARNHDLFSGYLICLTTLVNMVPIIILTPMTLGIAKAMRKRSEEALGSTPAPDSSAKSNVMVVGVLISFEILRTPNMVKNMLLVASVYGKIDAGFVDKMNPITTTCSVLNTAINFMLYCMLGRDFRRKLFKIFGRG